MKFFRPRFDGSGEKNFHRLNFFDRIYRIERKSHPYSNSPQILHLLSIFRGDTSSREMLKQANFKYNITVATVTGFKGNTNFKNDYDRVLKMYSSINPLTK